MKITNKWLGLAVIAAPAFVRAGDGNESFVPLRNHDYTIRSSCYGYKEYNCYPLHYENIDGSFNVFPNYVAYLNILAPCSQMLMYGIGSCLLNKWDSTINDSIETKLLSFRDVEKNLRKILAEIIAKFDNGIGDGNDRLLIISMLELLNNRKCGICIDDFAKIVSRQLADGQVKLDNRQQFSIFIGMYDQGCQGHEFTELSHAGSAAPDEGNCAQRTCCRDSTSAYHWSSLLYFVGTTVGCAAIAQLIDINNRSGSYIGDTANLVNAFVIPTAYPFALFQQWRNLGRMEKKRLVEEIKKRFEAISGIIEIAGSIIGQMNNGIGTDQARGFIKALMLINWPDNLVEEFITIASKKDNLLANAFVCKLKTLVENEKDLRYWDSDMHSAFAQDIHLILPDLMGKNAKIFSSPL